MNRRLLLSAVWLASALFTRAFVLDQDAQGRYLRWDLTAPPGSTSTNVVNPTTHAIRFFIGANAYSATNRAAELNVVRDCFAQWQAVSGIVLKFEEGGLMGPGVHVNTADNTNVVFWARTTLVNGGRDDSTMPLRLLQNRARRSHSMSTRHASRAPT